MGEWRTLDLMHHRTQEGLLAADVAEGAGAVVQLPVGQGPVRFPTRAKLKACVITGG